MLDIIEGRVLGSLIEKQLTTPDTYPLSLNSLVLACNQATNREPVMSISNGDAEAALAGLKERKLARFVHATHGRGVTKYRQVSEETMELPPAEVALLALLLLRGPQTPGELRGRSDRLYAFDSVPDVDEALDAMAAREPALVERLERQPGQSQLRWRQLLAEEALVAPVAGRTPAADTPAIGLSSRVAELEERVARLEAALAELL